MLKFINSDVVTARIEKDILKKLSTGTKRNGNSISLRPIVYNCVREVYFEIFDFKKELPTSLDTQKGFYWTGPIGSAIHEKFQDLMGLTDQQYTERLMTFKSFDPLLVRSKCDGIDLRDPNNIILYEIKTKKDMVTKPYPEEVLQNLLSVFFFRKECKLDIKGSTMVYISRDDPFQMSFFNYEFFDKNSPVYFDISKPLLDVINKVNEIRHSMLVKKPPSMNSKYVKKMIFGRSKCAECLYRGVCRQYENANVEDDYYVNKEEVNKVEVNKVEEVEK